jgi:hypothetical protein
MRIQKKAFIAGNIARLKPIVDKFNEKNDFAIAFSLKGVIFAYRKAMRFYITKLYY